MKIAASDEPDELKEFAKISKVREDLGRNRRMIYVY